MVTIYRNTPMTQGGQNYTKAVAMMARHEAGDRGTCVMGMNLKWRGMTICRQLVQGSLSNEFIFDCIIDSWVHRGMDRADFTIDYGRMD